MTFEMFLTALVVGLFGGWLAGPVMKNGGHGLLQDLAVALAGSTLATWILQALGSSDEGVFVTSVVAFTGAATLIVAQRKLWRAHS
jgi:uncharacterized membrane protein YeaQ/YmgE (transglycosylase-associated protein family)